MYVVFSYFNFHIIFALDMLYIVQYMTFFSLKKLDNQLQKKKSFKLNVT